MCVCAKLLQSCLTACDYMDYGLPGFSVHGILQARVLELGAIAFSDIIHEGSSYQEASLVAQLVKSPPVMQETHVRFLGWEDPLEKG